MDSYKPPVGIVQLTTTYKLRTYFLIFFEFFRSKALIDACFENFKEFIVVIDGRFTEK